MMVSPLEAVRAKPPASKLRMVEVATLVVPPSSVLMEAEGMEVQMKLPVERSYCRTLVPVQVASPAPYRVEEEAYPVTQRLPETLALLSREVLPSTSRIPVISRSLAEVRVWEV